MRRIPLSLLILPLLLVSSMGYAASRKPSSDEQTNSVSNDEAPKPSQRPRGTKKNRFLLNTFLANQQISAMRNTTNADFQAQFYGINVSYTRRVPFEKSRWHHFYTGGLWTGLAKGKARANSITNNLNNQGWYAFSLTPGLSWRSTSVAEVSLSIPLMYRVIQWQVAKSSGLTVDQTQNFSYGPSLTYSSHLSPVLQFVAEISHQLLWNSTFWSLGLGYNF